MITKKIIEYKIVCSEEVQNLINNAWQPYGEPIVRINGLVQQAMVKYSEEVNVPILVKVLNTDCSNSINVYTNK